MSQRTADELEFRRGMVLGLTLAEVLLLLLFVLILALSWQIRTYQSELVEAQQKTESFANQVKQLEGTLGPLAPLLATLRDKGGLDVESVDQLAITLAKTSTAEAENSALKKENSDLRNTLGSARLIGADVAKLKAANDAITAAAKINPKDPPEVLTRALEVLKRLGPETRPDQLNDVSELVRDSQKLHALDKAVAAATRINPTDPPEAVTRAVEILGKLGANTKPEQVMTLELQSSLAGQLERARGEVANLTHGGNGLTLPSCWITPSGQTEYMFDVTIQDDGLVVRDATPGRAKDPAMQYVSGIARSVLIKDIAFNNGTAELYKYSQKQNCRFYSIIRDQTGPTSKKRYKDLRTLVESHFYPLLRSDPWTGRSDPFPPGTPAIGGEFVPAPTR
jgi:hypothetical protein